jgi:hypothetical protein
MISKVFRKVFVSFGLVQNLEISDFAIAKDEKVNIEVTYLDRPEKQIAWDKNSVKKKKSFITFGPQV